MLRWICEEGSNSSPLQLLEDALDALEERKDREFLEKLQKSSGDETH